MNEIITYIRILGVVLTASSVLFAVLVFWVSTKRERVRKTLDYWEEINNDLKQLKREIRNDYGIKISEYDAKVISENREQAIKLNRVINTYERLAVGIDLKIYDIQALNRLVGRRIIRNYNRFENYIILRRKNRERYAWRDFESLKNKLEKLRGNRDKSAE